MSVNKIIDFEQIYEHLSIKDSDNPHSVINIAPAVIADRVKTIPDEYFDMTEYELEKTTVMESIDKKLRTSFWLEYARAVRTSEKMNINNIFCGICTITHLRSRIQNTFRLLYIITPRPDYNVELEDLLYVSVSEMRKILEMPIEDENGKRDHKLMSLKKGIWEELTTRRRGVVAQKLEMRSQNLHVVASDASVIPESVEAIDKELAMLESKSNPLPIAEVIDVQEEEKEEIPR